MVLKIYIFSRILITLMAQRRSTISHLQAPSCTLPLPPPSAAAQRVGGLHRLHLPPVPLLLHVLPRAAGGLGVGADPHEAPAAETHVAVQEQTQKSGRECGEVRAHSAERCSV